MHHELLESIEGVLGNVEGDFGGEVGQHPQGTVGLGGPFLKGLIVDGFKRRGGLDGEFIERCLLLLGFIVSG